MFALPKKLRIAISAYALWFLAVVLTTGFTFEDFLNWSEYEIDRMRILLIFPPLFALVAYVLLRWCLGNSELEGVSGKLKTILSKKYKPDPSNQPDIPIPVIKVLAKAQRDGKPVSKDAVQDLVFFNDMREDVISQPELGKPKKIDLRLDGLDIQFEEGGTLRALSVNAEKICCVHSDGAISKMPLPKGQPVTPQTKLAKAMNQLSKDLEARGMRVTRNTEKNDQMLKATFVSERPKSN